MSKILLLSDIHAHNFQAFNRPTKTGINYRLQKTLECIKQAAYYAHLHPIDAIFILGDVFHAHNRVEVDVLHHTYEAIKHLASMAPTYILVGNHDQSSKDGRVHSLNIFSDIATVVEHPETFYLDCGLTVGMCPFIADTNAWKSIIWHEDMDIFCFHQGLNEAKVGAFDIQIPAAIKLSDLPKARWTFAGHYHKHQQVAPDVFYVGSPLQHNMGERSEEKGYLILDTDTEQVEQIPTRAPRFYLFNSVKDFSDSKLDASENYVKLVLNSDEPVDIPNVVVEYLKDHQAVDLEDVQPVHKTDESFLRDYVERVGTDLDKEVLIQIGKDLLEE